MRKRAGPFSVKLQARFRVWSSSPLKVKKKTQRRATEVHKASTPSKDRARENRVRATAIAKASSTLNEAKICNRGKKPRTLRRNRARRKTSRAKATAKIINRPPATNLIKTPPKSSQERHPTALSRDLAGAGRTTCPNGVLRRR